MECDGWLKFDSTPRAADLAIIFQIWYQCLKDIHLYLSRVNVPLCLACPLKGEKVPGASAPICAVVLHY